MVRAELHSIAASANTVLEIGPFFSPAILGDHVKYFDVLPRENLVAKAVHAGLDPARVPYIDYVADDGDMSFICEKFHAVFSAHCIEHQVDLVKNFEQVSLRLLPGGKYYLVVPDKRYCFDHFHPASTLEMVDMARGSKRHSVAKVINHFCLVVCPLKSGPPDVWLSSRWGT